MLTLREMAENKLDLDTTKDDLVKVCHEEVLVEPEEQLIESEDQPVDERFNKKIRKQMQMTQGYLMKK